MGPGYLCNDVAFFNGFGIGRGGDEETENGGGVTGKLAANAEGWMDVTLRVRFYPLIYATKKKR